MHKARSWPWGPALGICFWAATPVMAAEPPGKIDFAHDIAPLIQARCAECHTNGTYKGSFSLDTRETMLESEAVVPGKPDKSELVARLTSSDLDERMPPRGKAPLSTADVARFQAWIAEGAAWEPGFTFKRETYVAPVLPRRVLVPPATPGNEHPIDRILAAYYTAHQVVSPPQIDDAGFARRAYLDLIGLLPEPDELASFLANSNPAKRGQLARDLLDDRRAFADHWLSFWNDLLRNDYKGPGYVDGGRKQIAEWLYDALLDNKPYDEFVRELIHPTPASEGFVFGIIWRGRVNASQTREIQFSQNVSQVFFGINMKCASCHDSFIDRWKLADAYGLAAVVAEKPLEIHRCDKATGQLASARFLWPELGTIDPAAPRKQRLEQLASLVTSSDNGRFQRTIVNRIWQRLMGRGIVHPVDVMANRPWNEDLLDYLAGYLVDQHYDLKALLEHIVSSHAYQSRHAVREDEPAADDYVFAGPEVRRLTAEQFIDAVWMITGTAPAKAVATVKTPPAALPAREFVRAALTTADPLMRSLGRPVRDQVVTTRPDQLTTLQALDLSNGAVLANTLTRGAANLIKAQRSVSSEQLVEQLWIRTLCRQPTSEELAAALEIISPKPTPDSVADLLWIVFELPEFQLIR